MTTDRSDNESTDARESGALYRLMSWLSPAYPVGAFSYSGGLEWAVEAGDVKDAATLADWLGTMITNGSVFCDAVFFVHAHTASRVGNDEALRAVAELASAFASSKERHLETTAQGRAFMDATLAAWPCEALTRLESIWPKAIAYPVAVGVAAGVRLIPLGQTAGQRVLAELEPVVAFAAQAAITAPLDEVGSATFRADIAGMRHEIQYTRLFRS
jgi:urease accessory protein